MDTYEFQKAQERGQAGEKAVARILAGLNRQQYIVLNNILLRKPYADQNEVPTVQIDHLVVSLYGIFAIETKNYSGSIYGYEDAKEWKIYLGNREYRMLNPLRQNYAHTKTIQQLLMGNATALGIQNADFAIYPIIAFSNSANISKVQVENVDVVHFNQIPNAILNKSTMPLLTYQQMESIARFISSLNTYSPENMYRHVEAIRMQNGYGEVNDFMPVAAPQTQDSSQYQQYYYEGAEKKYRYSTKSSKVWLIISIVLSAIFITIFLLCGGCMLCFSGCNSTPSSTGYQTKPTTQNNVVTQYTTVQPSTGTTKPKQPIATKPKNVPQEKNITVIESTIYTPKTNAENEIAYICHGSYHSDSFTDKDGVNYDGYIEMFYHDAFWDGIYIDINAQSYNTLSFTYTNGHQFSDKNVLKMTVKDTDTDEVLLETEAVEMYHSKTATVDITGHDNIRIELKDENQRTCYVCFKDIILSDPVN